MAIRLSVPLAAHRWALVSFVCGTLITLLVHLSAACQSMNGWYVLLVPSSFAAILLAVYVAFFVKVIVRMIKRRFVRLALPI